MPDVKMIKAVGDIDIACAIYTSNYYFAARTSIFSRNPLLKAKKRASE